jgi:glutathione S-transferase
VRWFEDYCDNEFVPYTTQLLVQLRKPEAERDAHQVEQIRERLRRGLYLLRDRLESNEYLVGKEFTLADASWAPRMLVLGRLGFEFEPALAPVQAWVDRIRVRSSVKGLGL